MKVEPAAAQLLDVARTTILDEIVPQLDGAGRYAALMAAKALAIAQRDLAASPAPAAEIARLSALLADWTPAGDDESALRHGNALLAARIREGRFDEAEARTRLLAHLRETTRERLAVSNPRVLRRAQDT